MNLDAIQRILRPLAVKVSNLAARAVVKLADDSTAAQLLQLELLPGELRNEIERFQNYGFTSVPLAPDANGQGPEAAVLFVNGRREHGLAVSVEDRRYRLKNLQPGEVATFNFSGAKIVIRANGDVEVTPKTGQKLRVAGDVDVSGTLTASVDVVGGGKSLKTHTHPAGGLAAPSGGGAVTGVTGGPT